MSPVALGLDALLAALLMAALWIGVRLNSRLKALKDSQTGFVAAVGDLDRAAVKADAALREIREASTEVHDSLLARIETARALIVRLEKAAADTETAAKRAETAGAQAREAAAAAPMVLTRPEPRLDVRHEPRAPSAALAGLRERLDSLQMASSLSAKAADLWPTEAKAAPRRRSLIDEDLFETASLGPIRPPAANAGPHDDLAGLLRGSLGGRR